MSAAREGQRAERLSPAVVLHHTTMLRWLLVQNRQGKSRLSKFYVPLDDEEKVRLKGEVHRLFGGEIIEQIGLGQTRNLGDLVKGRAAETVGGKNVQRCIEDGCRILLLNSCLRAAHMWSCERAGFCPAGG